MTILRRNCGTYGQYVTGDGRTFSADSGYNTGNGTSSPASIAGTTDDPLYYSQRWDSASSPEMMYSFTVDNGTYTVKLHFSENYAPLFSVGARVFDIYIEGVLVEDNFDIYAEAGSLTALIKTYVVEVTDGQINIQFIHHTEDPTICAIEVIQHEEISVSFDSAIGVSRVTTAVGGDTALSSINQLVNNFDAKVSSRNLISNNFDTKTTVSYGVGVTFPADTSLMVSQPMVSSFDTKVKASNDFATGFDSHIANKKLSVTSCDTFTTVSKTLSAQFDTATAAGETILAQNLEKWRLRRRRIFNFFFPK